MTYVHIFSGSATDPTVIIIKIEGRISNNFLVNYIFTFHEQNFYDSKIKFWLKNQNSLILSDLSVAKINIKIFI